MAVWVGDFYDSCNLHHAPIHLPVVIKHLRGKVIRNLTKTLTALVSYSCVLILFFSILTRAPFLVGMMGIWTMVSMRLQVSRWWIIVVPTIYSLHSHTIESVAYSIVWDVLFTLQPGLIGRK